MAQLIVVYWRDIPAQVIVREGRVSEKRELPERFIQAVDRAAMRAGARDTDTYLAEWRKATPVPCEGDLAGAADGAVARIEAEYDAARLDALVRAGGRAEG